MKRLSLIFWAYWKWFCTALVTSTLLLMLVAFVVGLLDPNTVSEKDLRAQCIETGGTWDESDSVPICRAPA
jgi:hypothetical protein